MTLTELLPEISALPHEDKLRLKQVLDNDLVVEEVHRLFPSGECPIWSPFEAYEAAAVMQKFLDDKKANTL